MPKAVKYLLIATGVVIAVLIAIAGYFAATFNPNDYKPLIIKTVQEKKQRTLTIPGEIKLTFFPKIGADLGQVGLSEHGQPDVPFASIKSAKVSLALLPLFSKRLIVDHVSVEGIRATVIKNKDGTMNIDDLMSKEESSGQQVEFDIDSVHVGDSGIVYDDRQAGRRFELAELNLDTGRIADGAKSKLDLRAKVKSSKPEADVAVDAKSGFLFELEKKHYVLDGLNAEVKGNALGFTDMTFKARGNADLKPEDKRFALDGINLSMAAKSKGSSYDVQFDIPKLAATDKEVSVTGKVRLDDGKRKIDADVSMPSFEGSPQAFRIAALNLDAAIKDAEMDAKAKISGAFAGDIDKMQFSSPQLKLALDGKSGGHAINGSLTTPLAIDLKEQTIRLSAIAAAFTLPNPAGGTFKFVANGRADADLDKSTLASSLKGSIDDSAFDAKFGMSDFSPAAYTFDIGIDRIDADRYRAKPPAGAAAKAEPANAPETPIDFSALKTLKANGSLRVGALKVQNIRMSNVRMDVRAGGGRLDVHSLSAALYGGSVSGGLSAIASDPPRIELQQTLAGINVGPLLKDAIAKSPVDGKGNVKLDVHGQGATFSRIKKSLAGSARLNLRDGSIQGVNIAKTLREAKAKIGVLRGGEAPQSGTGSAEEKTDFSELSASFNIANGVAHNEDLDMKSPLFRVGGSGDVDLGNDRLDYLVRATVVSSLQGQGGPELQALKGLTVPVRLSGPFTAIGWKVDFAGIASGIARQKIEEKKEEVREKVQKKVQEQLGDKLKGLFGR